MFPNLRSSGRSGTKTYWRLVVPVDGGIGTCSERRLGESKRPCVGVAARRVLHALGRSSASNLVISSAGCSFDHGCTSKSCPLVGVNVSGRLVACLRTCGFVNACDTAPPLHLFVSLRRSIRCTSSPSFWGRRKWWAEPGNKFSWCVTLRVSEGGERAGKTFRILFLPAFTTHAERLAYRAPHF